LTRSPHPCDWQTYRRLWRYVRPYYGAWAVALVGFLLFASGQPLMAVALKYFVDGLTDPALGVITLPWGERVELLPWIPALLVAAAAWQGLGTFLGQFGTARVAAGVVHDLRRDLFAQLLRLPHRYFLTHESGRTVSRLTHDVTLTATAVTDAVRVVVREGLTVAALLAYLLWSNWRLTLALLAVLPLVAITVRHTQRRLRQAAQALQETMGELTGQTTETVRALLDLRAFGAESLASERFAQTNHAEQRRQEQLARIAARQTALTQLLTFAAMGVLLWLVLALRGEATVGELVSYVTAAGLIPKPLRQLTEVGSRFARGLAGAESAFALLDAPAEAETGDYAPPLPSQPCGAEVCLTAVSYRYPGACTWALRGVTLRLAPNTMTALVGPSGSGKSTLAHLFLRWDDPQEGEILFDGVPLPAWQRAALRQRIAYVPQQPVLLAATVAENVAIGAGDRPVSRQEIAAALQAAHAWEFVSALPQGMDTPIGENGAQLSGGQRQRIALARAFLKRAPLLILDEATSALDHESEQAIQSALEAVRATTTIVVITHRLATVQRADCLVVLEGGVVIESGSYQALLAAGGRFAQLASSELASDPVIKP